MLFHRSPRLLLRPVFAEDWQAIYAGINDFAVVSMLASAPWPYREEDAREFAALPCTSRSLRFAIALPGLRGAPVIGGIGFEMGEEGAEVGYWLARPYWGRGYATEAGAAVVEMTQALGIERLVADYAIDNPASGRVLAKLGFRETGEVREQFSRGRGGLMPVRRMVLDMRTVVCDRAEPHLQAA